MTMINEVSVETEQTFTYAPSMSILELPRLIYPVSFFGAVKLDFMKKLAGALGASFVGRETILQKMVKGQKKQKPPKIGETANSLLKIGEDVVIEKNFNGKDDRASLAKIARATGATTICLSIWSDESIAERRVKEWDADGSLETPKDGRNPVDIMHEGFKKHKTPSQGEADFIFPLDGTLGTTYLLDRVFEQLERYALLDEGLAVMDPRNLAS